MHVTTNHPSSKHTIHASSINNLSIHHIRYQSTLNGQQAQVIRTTGSGSPACKICGGAYKTGSNPFNAAAEDDDDDKDDDDNAD
jgi:hypothetical protein